jgi:glutamate/tyrosine decarboxylase-like PLP-dependent enzyme
MPTPTAPATLFDVIAQAQAELDAGFSRLPAAPETVLDDTAAAILAEAAGRMHDNYPYGHPLYAGQMLKPPHPIARAAYTMAMAINPNNHALDGGRASSAMELEAVGEIAKMFGWTEDAADRTSYLGHLTSSGTFANLEALWVGGQVNPGKTVVASDQAHYTHTRISGVLGLPFAAIRTDERGRMDMAALERELETPSTGAPIGTVVATLGTTAIGAVDPLPRILQLQQRYGFRIHVDSAYGGYFMLARNLGSEARAAYDAIPRADSIVVDPHKHGLQPYGCGAILFRDPTVGRFYKHDSPFTYFSSKELHLGEISLECSRAGASAVALWATQRLLPYIPGGEFGKGIEAGRDAALSLYARLAASRHFITPATPPMLDILFWAVRANTTAESSRLAQAIFDEAANRDLYLALATLPARYFPPDTWPDATAPDATVVCLRSVQMKPEHLAWGPEIWTRLDAATAKVVDH